MTCCMLKLNDFIMLAVNSLYKCSFINLHCRNLFFFPFLDLLLSLGFKSFHMIKRSNSIFYTQVTVRHGRVIVGKQSLPYVFLIK